MQEAAPDRHLFIGSRVGSDWTLRPNFVTLKSHIIECSSLTINLAKNSLFLSTVLFPSTVTSSRCYSSTIFSNSFDTQGIMREVTRQASAVQAVTLPVFTCSKPPNKYHTRTMFEICSKLPMKKPERCQ